MLGAIEIYFMFFPASNDFQERSLVKDYCLNYETAMGGFSGTEYTDLTDCEVKVDQKLFKDEMMILGL